MKRISARNRGRARQRLVPYVLIVAVMGCGASNDGGVLTPPQQLDGAANATAREATDPVVSHVEWSTIFADIDDIKSSADLVVHARVMAVEEDGRVGGTSGKDAAIQFRELTAEVKGRLFGNAGETIRILQEGYSLFPAGSVPEDQATRFPYSPDGMRWAQPGDELVVVLKRVQTTAGEAYTIVNSQSLFFVEDGVLASSGEVRDDRVIDQIAGGTVEDVTDLLSSQ